MTRLLVSVRDEAEASAALAAGVDLLDVKEPRQGSLGAAPPVTIDRIVQRAAAWTPHRVPVSAALGELREFNDQAWRSLRADYAKLGLAGCADLDDWPSRWRRAWRTLPAQVNRIAVIYADAALAGAPAPEEILAVSAENVCAGVLIDTFDKRGGDLFAHLSPARLRALGRQIQGAGRLWVLAGSLRSSSLEQALELEPDYVAVRGAVCRGAREAALDAELVQALAVRLRNAPRKALSAGRPG